MKQKDYKTQLLEKKVISFVPGGNSMWPTIKHASQSVIVKLKQSRLKKWEVAFYLRDNGTFVLHRVIELLPDGYVMCGDSQQSLERVREDQVFGVMEGFYRGKKYVKADDKKHLEWVEKFYARKRLRKIRLKIFYCKIGIKNRLKRLFCRGKTK